MTRRSHARAPVGVAAVLLLLITAGAVPRATAEPLSEARQQEILHDAFGAYDQAVAIARDDPTQAVALYKQAAGGFHALTDAGLSNAGLEYNLGNVHFRLGELGHAILHYRRAQRLAPADARLAANLDYARKRVEPVIAPTGQSRLAHQLLFWHYGTSIAQRTRALLALTVLGWAMVFAWLRWRWRPLLVVGFIGVALALAAGTSIHWQIQDESREPYAVIVDDEQFLRLGRGEGSDLALKQPLGPGVELRILQQRGDWIEVRLPNDQAGWLSADAVARI